MCLLNPGVPIPPWRRISSEHFATLVAPLIGLQLSDTWRGYGSAIFLELGQLARDSKGRQRGQATVMVEWDWRIEGPRSILLGSSNADRKISAGVKALNGRRVLDISLFGRIPELSIALSGSRWLTSFMTADGQPRWTVFLGDGTCLTVVRGVLIQKV